MKHYSFWQKTSNVSAYTCGFVAIVHTFFRNYIESFIYVIITIEVVAISLFLISEVMKFILKKKYNPHN